MIILHFRVKELYDERELEELFECLERRGGNYCHLGSGQCQLLIPSELPWRPFCQTIRDCNSVQLTGAIATHQQ